MNGSLALVMVLALLSGGATGSVILLYRARAWRRAEARCGVRTPGLAPAAATVGALAGAATAALAAHYASLPDPVRPVEWVGRASYALILWAAAGHLLALARVGMLVRQEVRGWREGLPAAAATLGARRRQTLEELRRRWPAYGELKSRDDALVEDLVEFLGGPLQKIRRDLGRLPLYGYLGTVCGILLMAEDLSGIDAATETFKVLGSMARGLVLAFNTTLVGLLAYLPLRKASDLLVERVGWLEDEWRGLRDRQEFER